MGSQYRPGDAIVLAPYDARWPVAFNDEASRIKNALSGVPIMLHHIGSTAIPGIVAKPVIDLLGVVPAVADLDRHAHQLVSIGYQAKGEYGIPGRRYFQKTAPDGARTHHLHVFATGSPEIDRHLDFRDYLRAFPAEANAYATLKQDLATRVHTRDEYSDGKTEFIRAIEQRAAAWREGIVGTLPKEELPLRLRVLRAVVFWLIVVSIPIIMLMLTSAKR